VDLVTCTGCKHVFSPTPGQRVRCPACMQFAEQPAGKQANKVAVKAAVKANVKSTVKPAAIKPTRPASSSAAAPRRRPAKDSTPAQPIWLFVVLALAVVGAGGLWFATRPRSTEKPPDVAELPTRPPKVVLPDVVDPEVPQRPDRKSEAPPIDPPNLTPDEPTKSKTAPKTRPIDITALPEVDGPEIKTKRFEIKKIAGVTPEKVNAAIRRGVAFLVQTSPEWSTRNGTWDLGVPSLCGLALLECETPPTSPTLQQIANHVRSHCLNNIETYEISLAILFLDRLGQAKDRGLIQTLAARLIASQDAAGAWDYKNHDSILTQPETVQLLSILQRNRPVAARPLVPLTIGADRPTDKLAAKGRDPFADPFADPLVDPPGAEADPKRDAKGDAKSDPGQTAKKTVDDRPMPPKILPRSRLSGQPVTLVVSTPAPTPLPATGLTQRIQDIPIVKQRDRSRSSLELDMKAARDDLSNTQFAVLALWAARRHGVVSDRALLLTDLRLRKTQLSSGSWIYKQTNAFENVAMTCSGLLGLALGAAVDQPHGASLAQSLKTDPAIQLALDNLGSQTGDPLADYDAVGPVLDLYWLWSIERVAMIYHQKTIRGKDWYGWGAQNLIKNQDPNGSWLDPKGHSHSAPVDTSLAILFLVRSNLVQEITEQIRLQMPIQER
jgi:hypothetical protein